MDHGAGQVGDAHRLAHVEHEHVAAARHRTGLHDELGRFRDEHEVANDVGVGDGDRPARRDLAAEQRHHRARGTEHVAEADHREHRARAVAHRGRLEDELGGALRGAHHVGRPHRLVGGDEDAGFGAGVERGTRDGERAEDVVAQPLLHVRFHDRHVLVGRSVIDRLHAVLAHHRAQQRVVEHRAEAGDEHRAVRLMQLAVDGVERELGVVEQHQLGRPLRGDLAAELAADGATGTGDHDDFAGDVAREQARLRRHRVSAEQVGDVDLADVRHLGLAVDQLEQARQDLHRQAGAFHALDQPAFLRRAGRRNGQHDLLDLMAEDGLAELRGLVDRQPGDDLAVQVGPVVEKAYGGVVGADLHRLRKLRTGAACAVDGSSAAVPAGLLHAAAQQRAGDETRGDHVGEGDEPEHRQGRARQHRDVDRPGECEQAQHHGGERRARCHEHAQVDVAHDGAVQAGDAERG